MTIRTARNPMQSRFSQLTLAVVLSFFVILAPLPALAADDYGLEATADAAGIKTNKPLPELVGQIVGAGLSLLGIVFLGLMLYGGFRWMTARGDTKMVTEAKDTITNAIIGIAIVVGAYAITDFVINAVVGAGGGGGAAAGGGAAVADQEVVASCRDNCVTFCEVNAGGDVSPEQCMAACEINC